MKKHFLFPLLLVFFLALVGCGTEKEVSLPHPMQTEVASTVQSTELIDVPDKTVKESLVTVEDLQNGTWAGISDTLYEEFYFSGRSVIYTGYILDRADKATVSEAVFYIAEDKLILYFEKTDYTNVLDLAMEDGVPVISVKYPEEDTARVYRKIDETNSIPVTTVPTQPPKENENVSFGMTNALQAAKNYLAVMPFSHSGLIEQLEFEGYSYSEAAYAADNCGADWYEQAAKKAKQYLEIMAFSRSGLIDQLEFDGFTYEQAVYGVDTAY